NWDSGTSRARQNAATLCPLSSCSETRLRHFTCFIGWIIPEACRARRAQARWGSGIAHGYIDWATYEENQRMTRRNAVNWQGDESMAAIRAGQGLLVGLLRCGHCGRKL